MKLRGRIYQGLSFLVLTPLVIMGNACSAGFKSSQLGLLTVDSSLGAVHPPGQVPDSSTDSTPTPTPALTPGPTATPSSVGCTNEAIIQSHRLTEMRSAQDPAYAAVVSGYSQKAGGQIVAYPEKAGGGSQYRALLQLDDCTYQIQTTTTTGLCFDAGVGNDAPLTHEACQATKPSQRWVVQKNTDNTFRLSVADGRCLEMKNLTGNNVQLRMQVCTGAIEQKYTLTKWTDGSLSPALTPVMSTETATAGDRGTSINEPKVSANSFGISFNVNARSWEFPQPGAFVDYDVVAAVGGEFSVQMIYSSWLPGAGVDVTVNNAAPVFMPFPYEVSGDPTKKVETQAFPIVLSKGLNRIRFAMPAGRFVPYTLNMFYIAHTGEKLTQVGQLTEVSPTAKTVFDIAKINRLYRFTLDSTLSERAWRYPHNVAHLEYKLHVARAGRYKVAVRYSSPSGQDRIALAVNGILRISEYVEIAGRIPLPSTGKDMGEFRDSEAVEISLPAGEVRLGFLADADAVSMYVREYAISAITLTPVP
jgi:hypothetical protein